MRVGATTIYNFCIAGGYIYTYAERGDSTYMGRYHITGDGVKYKEAHLTPLKKERKEIFPLWDDYLNFGQQVVQVNGDTLWYVHDDFVRNVLSTRMSGYWTYKYEPDGILSIWHTWKEEDTAMVVIEEADYEANVFITIGFTLKKENVSCNNLFTEAYFEERRKKIKDYYSTRATGCFPLYPQNIGGEWEPPVSFVHLINNNTTYLFAGGYANPCRPVELEDGENDDISCFKRPYRTMEKFQKVKNYLYKKGEGDDSSKSIEAIFPTSPQEKRNRIRYEIQSLTLLQHGDTNHILLVNRKAKLIGKKQRMSGTEMKERQTLEIAVALFEVTIDGQEVTYTLNQRIDIPTPDQKPIKAIRVVKASQGEGAIYLMLKDNDSKQVLRISLPTTQTTEALMSIKVDDNMLLPRTIANMIYEYTPLSFGVRKLTFGKQRIAWDFLEGTFR